MSDTAVTRFSVAMPTALADALASHLRRSDGQEDCAFLLWRPSTGAGRMTAVVGGIVLPEPSDRIVHGTVDVTSEFFLRAAATAADAGCGVALVHSHPTGGGWQTLNTIDFDAEASFAAQASAITGHPLVGLTFAGADAGYGARLWQRDSARNYSPLDAENVRVVGTRLAVTWNDSLVPPPPFQPAQLRTVSAWTPRAHASLVRLHIGIVGLGSVGMLVLEALARTGFTRLSLFDFDRVEEVNRDRLLHTSKRDVALRRAKIDIAARAARRSATADRLELLPFNASVVEPFGFAHALDCDVLFSCVDRPWPRAALNLIAYAHLLPVIDGGVTVDNRGGRFRGAAWRSHVAAPDRACLECLGQYDPSHVAAERDGSLDDPTYLAALPDDHPFRRRENVYAFSAAAAAAEVMQLVTLALGPSGITDTGAHLYHLTTGVNERREEGCAENCWYPNQLLATGDDNGLVVTGRHDAAEQARARQSEVGRSLRTRRWIDDFLWRLR